MGKEILTINIAEWVLKVRVPDGEGPHPVILLLHGWSGDENSMWVFASRLPNDALLVAPRAPHVVTSEDYEGHSWVKKKSGEWSWLDDFRPSVSELNALIDKLAMQFNGNFSRFNLVGFSQGAAMCYAYALLNPGRVAKMAGLAGFVPERCEEQAAKLPLKGVQALIAHGSQDQIVPLERAKIAVELMQMAGAEVQYCESDTAHKLGSNCFKALKTFFE